MRNYNSLLDRYPGADGMKTGFICASGYNVVASATRNGRRLIAIVLGAYSGAVRAQKAAQLLERGFNGGGLSWLTPSLGTVDALAPIDAQPPNLREEMCGGHRRKPPAEDNDEEQQDAGAATAKRRQRVGAGLHAVQPAAAERQVRARAAGRDRSADRGVHRPARPSGCGADRRAAREEEKESRQERRRPAKADGQEAGAKTANAPKHAKRAAKPKVSSAN